VIVHATAVARRVGRDWRAALLFGPSGAGKSDLALRALEGGWRLVSDDYTVVWLSGGRLWARAPDTIADRMEARGLGILPVDRLPLAEVVLAAQCGPDAPERLPEPETVEVGGRRLPCVRLRAIEASALAKLERALSTRALPAGAGSAYLGPSRERRREVPDATAETDPGFSGPGSLGRSKRQAG
jgi:serine kinase of HPr protein (carbohydrate metabolism regulator)